MANWTVPEKSGNFCSRGGRFGTHSSNENFTPVYYKRIMFFAHFNAGVRALDIRDPFMSIAGWGRVVGSSLSIDLFARTVPTFD